jgi:hypothetical protein
VQVLHEVQVSCHAIRVTVIPLQPLSYICPEALI